VTGTYEQLRRTKRWLSRCKETGRPQHDHLDFLYAFFQNCWHLKDWVRSENEAVHSEVVSGDGWKAIKACGPLANATKHLKLDRTQVSDAEFSRTNEVVLVVNDGAASEAIVSWKYYVDLNGERIVAIELAEEAVREWSSLLRKHELSDE
jgi:hypothetical protein